MHANINDSIVSSKKVVRYKDKRLLLPLVLILVLFGFWLLNPVKGVALETLSLATVQQGSLAVKVSGVGQLKSKNKRIITSKTSGVVEEILFYPGEELSHAEAILSLSNPKMKKELQAAELELERAKFNFKEFEFNQKMELIKHESDLTQLEAELEKVTMVIDAENKLEVVGIVSSLATEQKELDKRQLAQRVELEKKKVTLIRDMHEQSLAAQKRVLEQEILKVEAIKEEYNGLLVKASTAGILQSLHVDLGERVAMGDTIAQISRMDNLVAKLKIPQRLAASVKVGNHAVINTFDGLTQGIVTRVDPRVTDARVVVEVEALTRLSDNARPDLAVEGTIDVGTLTDILYIEQPARISPDTTHELFVISDESGLARRATLSFGAVAGKHIEIRSGVEPGDKIIVSKLTETEDKELRILSE